MHLDCGIAFKMEKNWIAFTSEEDERMYFVRRVVPHTIVVVHDDGSCDESEWLTDDFTPLSDLAEATGLRVHGSGTAARWGDGVNLALLHTKDEKGRYATMLYSFSSRPPFAVIAVSRPLPLQGGSSSFASGLAVLPQSDKVVVSYGAADIEGRALVMSTDYVRALFDWCTPSLIAAKLAEGGLLAEEAPTQDDNQGGTRKDGNASFDASSANVCDEETGASPMPTKWSPLWVLLFLASVSVCVSYPCGAQLASRRKRFVELYEGGTELPSSANAIPGATSSVAAGARERDGAPTVASTAGEGSSHRGLASRESRDTQDSIMDDDERESQKLTTTRATREARSTREMRDSRLSVDTVRDV